MKRTFLLLLVSLLAGCSAFQDATQSVRITCLQPETTLMINDVKRDCPTTIDLPRNRASLIEARKTGYSPSVRQIGYHLGEMGKLDLVGTVLLLVPVIGLVTAGAWDLDQTELTINLSPL